MFGGEGKRQRTNWRAGFCGLERAKRNVKFVWPEAPAVPVARMSSPGKLEDSYNGLHYAKRSFCGVLRTPYLADGRSRKGLRPRGYTKTGSHASQH